MLMECLSRGDWDRAKKELQRDPRLARSLKEVEGFLASSERCQVTPLHQACAHQAPLSFLRWLYRKYPPALQQRESVYHRLPLHVALMASELSEVILQLIEWEESTATSTDILGRVPLHYACNHKASEAVVQRLVQVYPEAVDQEDTNGWLPLHVACRFGMPLSVIQLLLEIHPQAIHHTTSRGTTPLMCAERIRNDELIQFLQEKANTIPLPLTETPGRTIRLTAAALTSIQEMKPSTATPEFFEIPSAASRTRFRFTTVVANKTTKKKKKNYGGQRASKSLLPRSNDKQGKDTSQALAPHLPPSEPLEIGEDPSEVSSLTNSSTTTSNNNANTLGEGSTNNELSRLAFAPNSPYLVTRHARMPFLGEKIDV